MSILQAFMICLLFVRLCILRGQWKGCPGLETNRAGVMGI